MNLLKPSAWLVAAAFSSFALFSCDKNDDNTVTPGEETEQVFSVGAAVLDPEGAYLLQTGSLESGEVTFLGNGANVTTIEPGFMAFIQGGSYYYTYLSSENTFSKYSYANQTLKLEKVIPFTLTDGFRYGHSWVDDQTLFVYGNTGAYKLIDVASMTIKQEGTLGVPARTGYVLSVGLAKYWNNKLYVGYSYGAEKEVPSKKYPDKTNYATDTAFFAVYDYPGMNNPVYSTDTRSTYPGNDRNGVLKTFEYENDLYVITAPLEMIGQNWDKPTGLFRFKKGETSVDKSYFFNISEKLAGDNVLGGGYAGDGKLVVRRLRNDLIKKWSDYGYANVQEYHVVDLKAGTVTSLNVPLSKSLATAPGILSDPEKGKVYFGVNTKDVDGNFYLYAYDRVTNSASKGLRVKDVDQVNSLLKIK